MDFARDVESDEKEDGDEMDDGDDGEVVDRGGSTDAATILHALATRQSISIHADQAQSPYIAIKIRVDRYVQNICILVAEAINNVLKMNEVFNVV
jgi:hypothetical protein